MVLRSLAIRFCRSTKAEKRHRQAQLTHPVQDFSTGFDLIGQTRRGR
jgi:hypothetical protein